MKFRKWRVFLCLAGIFFAYLGSAACGKREEEFLIEETELSAEAEESEAVQEEIPKTTIWVDVCGAVQTPGVYELEEDARVFEAVQAAGGLVDTADAQWLNQAAVLSDGEKLQVYTKEEVQEMKEKGTISEIQNTQEASTSAAEQGKVNLNTADLAQLQEIPGIGQVRAQAILDYREQTGRFAQVEDIQEVPGIKGKTFEKIQDYITVE